MTADHSLSSEKIVRHASKLDDGTLALCGACLAAHRATKPGERINCPLCRAALNHVRQRYGSEDYNDRRLMADENRRALRDMHADLVDGEIEG